MGCPSDCYIGENIVFSIVTHDPNTGARANSSPLPTYRIYEDDTVTVVGTGDEIDSGTMIAVNGEIGEYVAKVLISDLKYTEEKNYTIFIKATVDGDVGGIAYTFKARIAIAANIVQIDSDADAASRLKNGMQGVVFGQVTSVDSFTQLTVGSLAPVIKAHDILTNRVLTFTSGDARGQSVGINDYARITDATGTITTTVMAGNVANGDNFIIA